jgi:hypothetical protein
MIKRNFENEAELHNWIEQNIQKFLGEGVYLPGNFYIYTRRNKGAKPDGFFFDFKNSNWTIIETELLSHGVWPHIAEQITRFSIASKNPETLRNLRDSFFNKIEQGNLIEPITQQIHIPSTRLLKHIEDTIESTPPNIAIFIDEINEDLEDLAESLKTPISIFKVQKFDINGRIEYFSDDYFKDDNSHASFQTSMQDIIEETISTPQNIDLIANASIFYRRGKTKFYQTSGGERVLVKYSKQHANGGYWFAISPQLLEQMQQQSLTHIILQIGTEGFIKLPLSILNQYIKTANSTFIPGTTTIDHYHIHIYRNGAGLIMVSPDAKNNINLDQYTVLE